MRMEQMVKPENTVTRTIINHDEVKHFSPFITGGSMIWLCREAQTLISGHLFVTQLLFDAIFSGGKRYPYKHEIKRSHKHLPRNDSDGSLPPQTCR